MDRNNLELASSFIETHTDAAARELEILSAETAAPLLLTISLTQAQRLIMKMLPLYSAQILSVLTPEEASSILSGGNPNQIATILRHLPTRLRGGLLKLLPERLARKSRRLLKHAEDSVGAWMLVDVVMLPENINVADALHRIRESSNLGDGDAIQVLSDGQQPAGFVSIADLLSAGSDVKVSGLCRKNDSQSISSKVSLRAAASHPGWHKQDNLVVINPRGQVDGILRHRDLRKGLRVSPSTTLQPADDALFSGIGKAYLSTLGSLFSLINEPSSVLTETEKSIRESQQ